MLVSKMKIEQLNSCVKLAVILASYGWDLEQVRKNTDCGRLFLVYPTVFIRLTALGAY